MHDYLCPLCGETLKHWNQGIYECNNCEVDFPEEVLEDYEQ